MNTITLKTAKKLHKLAKKKGIELPESEQIFLLKEHFPNNVWLDGYFKDNIPVISNPEKYREWVNSYTTNELLKWLRQYKVGVKSKYNAFDSENHSEYADTSAEAIGLLAIKLLKEDLIK